MKNLVYNLSKSVGKGGANVSDDVLLVRFLIKRICMAPDVKGPYANLPLVGACDQELINAITWFQQHVRSFGKHVVVDGRIDPAPKGDGVYTITHLNGGYWKKYPQFRHYYEEDPLFPKELVQLLHDRFPVYV